MKFFVRDFCETMEVRVFMFGMQVDNDVLYRGIANRPSHAYYTPTLKKWGIYWFTSVHPSVRPSSGNSVTLFSSKISPKPFKIETSYLVYRFTMTSCIVGLKTGYLL